MKATPGRDTARSEKTMKIKTQNLLSVVSSILIAAGAAVSVQAQRPLNRPAPSPTPRPPITKVPGPVVKTPSTPDDKLANKVYQIYGAIRWKKELGLPPLIPLE